MKKIISVTFLISFVFCSLVASPLDSLLGKLNKDVLVDYEGKSEGKDIPKWVDLIENGKGYGSALEESLPQIKGKESFIAVGKDQKLSDSYVKAGINLGSQVFAKAEKKAGNKLGNEDSYTIPGAFSYYLPKVIDALLSSGQLKSEETCWLKYNKVDRNGNVTGSYYKCYSVWTLDSQLFEDAIKGLVENGEEFFMKLYEKLNKKYSIM